MITTDTPALPHKRKGFSTVEGEARADLVGTLGRGVVQPLGVQGKPERRANAGTERLGVACEDT